MSLLYMPLPKRDEMNPALAVVVKNIKNAAV
jgi:hypothetical protein